MQLTDVNGNIYGADGLEITGANGKPKTTGGVTPAALTKTDDTNVTLTLGGSPSNALLQAVSIAVGWTGTLADSRIASASTWNAKQNAITLTTTGTSGAATLVGSTLNIPQYSSVATTVYVANANSVTFANGTQFSVYLGGTPVTPVQITAGIYGATSTDFMPGYPMPAGVASKTRATLRSANPATNALEVYVANATTSTRGAVLTIPAGSAAGIYTADDNTTVSFTIGQRLYFMVRNPNVAGGAASGQISTLSFNYTLS